MADERKESFAALFEGTERGRGPARPRTGERLEVKITSIGKTSVFADLGALGGKLEGFFDRTELSDRGGKLMVDVGSSVSAVIANVDDAAGQIRLSPVFVRGARESEVVDEAGGTVRIPVARSGPLLVEGAHVRGTVTGIERYGVFVQIEGAQGRGGRGLVPAAETGSPRGADLRKLFPEGSTVEAKIVAITEDGKIRLSMKAMAEDSERANFTAYANTQGTSGEAPPPPNAAAPAGGAPRPPKEKPIKSFGTLGDLLGGVKAAPAKSPAASAKKR